MTLVQISNVKWIDKSVINADIFTQTGIISGCTFAKEFWRTNRFYAISDSKQRPLVWAYTQLL